MCWSELGPAPAAAMHGLSKPSIDHRLEPKNTCDIGHQGSSHQINIYNHTKYMCKKSKWIKMFKHIFKYAYNNKYVYIYISLNLIFLIYIYIQYGKIYLYICVFDLVDLPTVNMFGFFFCTPSSRRIRSHGVCRTPVACPCSNGGEMIDRPPPATQNGLEHVICSWPGWMFCETFKKHRLCSSLFLLKCKYIHIWLYVSTYNIHIHA